MQPSWRSISGVRGGIALSLLTQNQWILNLFLLHEAYTHAKLLCEFFPAKFNGASTCDTLTKLLAGTEMSRV